MNISCTYEKAELEEILGSVGDDVQIDRSVRIVGGKNIRIGNTVRVDAHCSLVATHPMVLGSHIHISFGSLISSGGGSVTMEDFTAFGPQVTLITATDGFTADALICVQAPLRLRAVRSGPVVMKKFSTMGAHSILLPNVTLGVGATVGALTVANRDVPEGHAVVGNPYKLLRVRDILKLEKKARSYLEYTTQEHCEIVKEWLG